MSLHGTFDATRHIAVPMAPLTGAVNARAVPANLTLTILLLTCP